MKCKLLLIILCISIAAQAQEPAADWYILEKGSSVAVIKAGVNDLTYYLAASGNKPVDKAAVDGMNNRVSFSPGSVVLVYAKVGDSYIATDMEGRNLVVKGDITRATRGTGAGVAYMKENIKTISGATMKKASYVWAKERKPGQPNATIQYAGKETVDVPLGKMYDINQTTVEMAAGSTFKKVE